MRLAALAIVALVGWSGEGWADASSDYVAKMRADLAREPGFYIGCVPGGCLRSNMKAPDPVRLASVPIIDVDSACRGKGGDSCVRYEQDAYDSIKTEWNDLDLNDRAVCLAITDSSISSDTSIFYRFMGQCVSARLEARSFVNETRHSNFRP